ncbi:MAG: ComF family protein, partial [Calditrichaeota bacterium]|nr:ComF family protein [Calditrichota bacterium]
MFQWAKTPFSWLLDFVYPPTCLVCKEVVENGDPICRSCFSKIQPFDEAEKLETLWISRHKTHPIYLDGFLAGFYFESNLQELLHLLKYQKERRLGTFFGRWLGRHLSTQLREWKIDWIVPVPLHPRKRRKRGYNQSELIARGVAAENAMTHIQNALKRTRNTPTNTGLSAVERIRNVSGAFVANPRLHFSGKRIVLIDDVITTGSTLNA